MTVQSGQSLWSIAEKVAPSADPRDVIADIVSLNQLQSAVVTPGQRIAIPSEVRALISQSRDGMPGVAPFRR